MLGEQQNPEYARRVRAREAELGERLYGNERAAIGADAPQAVSPEAGRILYALVIAARPRLVVEFGTSFGYSTIHLAAALVDLGSGTLVSTELLEDKARVAHHNLEKAGVASVVELRHGDARSTLSELTGPVDLLFLDGSNDLYVPVLQLLEHRLSPDAVIAADLSAGDPHHDRYRDHVNDPTGGYVTVEIPVAAGFVVSTRPRVS